MKRIFYTLVTIFGLLFFLGTTQLSHATGPDDTPEIALTILATTENSSAVLIDYSIPYPGYVEFSLFDDENMENKVWYKAQVREKGEHKLQIKRAALKPGVKYSYKFGYKGKMVEGNFSVG